VVVEGDTYSCWDLETFEKNLEVGPVASVAVQPQLVEVASAVVVGKQGYMRREEDSRREGIAPSSLHAPQPRSGDAAVELLHLEWG
jgi:hypothetical protein